MFVLMCAEGEKLQGTSEEEMGGTAVIFETRKCQFLMLDGNDDNDDVTERRGAAWGVGVSRTLLLALRSLFRSLSLTGHSD
jgi:hypothetical protein